MKKLILIFIMLFMVGCIRAQVAVRIWQQGYCSVVSCYSCRDTLVDPAAIEYFFMENPSIDEEGMEVLTQLTNLKELWLRGNDSDTFEDWNKKDYKKILSSRSLSTIYLSNMLGSEDFRRFVKNRYKNITIKDF